MFGNAHFRRFFLFSCLFFLCAGTLQAKTPKALEESIKLSDSLFNLIAGTTHKTSEALTKPIIFMGSRLNQYKPLQSTEETFRYIPSNVTYKDFDAVHESYPRTFQEAVKDTEGALFYDQIGNNQDTVFSLRGFSETDAIVLLVDGVRMNEVDGDVITYPLLDVTDIGTLEITRGSSSAIYGSNAFAGVVNISTRAPSTKPMSLFGGFEIGSHKGIRFHQGISGALEDTWSSLGGKWSYYFNGGRRVTNGFRDNGEARISSFNFKTSYDLADDLGRVFVNVKRVDDAISNPGELTIAGFEGNESQTLKPLDGRTYDMTTVSFGSDVKFLDKKLTASVLASWRISNSGFYTTSATFTDFADGFNPDTDLVTTETRSTDLIWQLNYEDEWENVKNNSTIGMEFRDGSIASLERDAFGGVIQNGTARETERSAEPKSVSFFWHQAATVFNRLAAHLGWRYDFHRLKTTDHLTPTDNISRTFSNTSVSTGLSARATEWMDLFFNYSQGFRVPNVAEIAPFSGTTSSGLQPEQSDSYELGTRIRLKDKGLLKFSWFLIDLEDEIAFDSTSVTAMAPFGQNVNIGKSRRSGIELRLDYELMDEVKLYGSYAWTKAYVRETTAGSSIVDGRGLGQVPQSRMTWGVITQPLKDLGEPWDGLKLSLVGQYTGKQHTQSFESLSQATLNSTGGAGHIIKSYTLWDLALSYAWKDKEIYFKVNNVFDNKYYSRAVAATSFGTALVPFGTFTFVTPGAPREIQFGMRYEL